jgi:hypothetical protein
LCVPLPETIAISHKGGNNATLATPALCPVCAAKYSEFIIHNPHQARDHLQKSLLDSETPEIAIQLDQPASLRFVEPHWLDLKTALENRADSNS